MSNWVEEIFGRRKPIIAMAHLPALPGTPRYNENEGVDGIISRVKEDISILLDGGVDGILFCNEDDRPYVLKAGIEQIAALTRIVSETRPKIIPFGVDFMWDPLAALAIGNATGASFIRGVFTGLYESDMGLWTTNAGEAFRFRRQINGTTIKLMFNVAAEFASSLGTRSVSERARSAVVSSLADGILVSGPMAGAAPDVAALQAAKNASGEVPVFLNTGATQKNVREYLAYADGVIVGSALKIDGNTWNPVDPNRVRDFVAKVESIRVETSDLDIK